MKYEEITSIVDGSVNKALLQSKHVSSLQEILKEKEFERDKAHSNLKSNIRFVIHKYYDQQNEFFDAFLKEPVPKGHEKDYGLEIEPVVDQNGASNLLYLTFALKHTLLTGERTRIVLKDKETLEKLEDFFSGLENALNLFIQRIVGEDPYIAITKRN